MVIQRALVNVVLFSFTVAAQLGAAQQPKEAADLSVAASAVSQIVAHRGASQERPECTLASILRAIEVGATAVEVDVRTSQDGVLFLLHDSTLDRTTDGRGTASTKTIQQLKQLDAGTWFDPAYQGERIPTLREALRACRDKIDVLIDLKEQGDAYSRAVADEVARHGDPSRTIVGVRSVEQARQFRRMLPAASQLGLIPNRASIESFAQAGVEMIRLWPKWIEQDGAALVRRVRLARTKLHLNGTDGMIKEVAGLLAHDPDSLSSDDPGRLRKTLVQLRRDGDRDKRK